MARAIVVALLALPAALGFVPPPTRRTWGARPLAMSATAEETAVVDPRLASIRKAYEKLMAPLNAAAPAGSKQENFVNIVDAFMAEYAESAYAAGLDCDEYVAIIGGLLSNVGKNLKDPYVEKH